MSASLLQSFPADNKVWSLTWMELTDSDSWNHRLVHPGGPILFRTKGAAETYLRKWLCEKIEEEYRDKDEEEKREYSSYFDHRTREKRVKKQHRRNLETLERLAENLYEGEYVSVQLEWELKQVEING